MSFHINMTGEGSNSSTQKQTIFNQPFQYPSGLTWEVEVDKLTLESEIFFENLFVSAEDNGGNSFFYPSPDGNETVCRYEWHKPWRNKAAAIRIGLVFRLQKGERPSVGYGYLATNEMFDTNNVQATFSISQNKLYEIKAWLKEEVNQAANPLKSTQISNFLNILYIKPSSFLVLSKGFAIGNGKIRYLPSRTYKNKHIIAALVKSDGRSNADARRKSEEVLHVSLALNSLVTGGIWQQEHLSEVPLRVTGKISRFKISDADKIYGKSFKPAEWGGGKINDHQKRLMRSLMEKFELIDSGQQKIFKMALFAHYGALQVESSNKTFAVVGYIAALSALSKHLRQSCNGKTNCSECGKMNSHPIVGDRKAISLNIIDHLSRQISVSTETNALVDKWVSRLYNDHRSSFVHAASHKFHEYGQKMTGSNDQVVGAPSALPNTLSVTSKLNVFISDYEKLSIVSRFLLLEQFHDIFGLEIPYDDIGLNLPDFGDRYVQEGYMGMPTKGWVQMTGHPKVQPT